MSRLAWMRRNTDFLFPFIFKYVGLGASPVLVVACSVGSEGLLPRWAWLCFGSVPEY